MALVVPSNSYCKRSLGIDQNGTCIRLSSKENEPFTFRLLKGTVRQVSGSYRHSGIVMDTGDLCMFGHNDYGQLGIAHDCKKKSSPVWVPRQLFHGKSVLMVSCGSFDTRVVTECGCVYRFGKGNMDPMGVANRGITQIPPLAFENEKVVMATSGYCTSYFLTEQGRVFHEGLWFSIGSVITTMIDQAPMTPVLFLDTSSWWQDDPIVFITSSSRSFAAISSNGQLFVCGANLHGLLGLGHQEEQKTPTVVDIGIFEGSKPIMVSTSVYNAAVVTSDGGLWISGLGIETCLFSKARFDTGGRKMDTRICTVELNIDNVAFGLTWAGLVVFSHYSKSVAGQFIFEVWTPIPQKSLGLAFGRCCRIVEHELAFLMGTHVRLGVNSPVRLFRGKQELLQEIIRWYRNSSWIRQLSAKSEGLARLVGGWIGMK